MLHRHLGRRDIGGILFGGILLFIGVYYLLRNTLGFDLGELDGEAIWPLFVLALGVVILVGALQRDDDDGSSS